MLTRLLVSTVLIGALCVADVTAQDAVERGRAIASESDARARGYVDLEARLTMILRSRDGNERIRELRIRVLEGAEQGDKTLLVFERPRDLAGTALLTHANPEGSDRHWLYLPAMNRVKRIGSSGQSGSFLGSEFSYEDIGSQKLEKYRYRYLEATERDGTELLLVERIPTDSESGYSRQIVAFNSKAHRIEEIVYYDRDGELLKTLRLGAYRLYDDRFWRPGEMEMVNHQTGKVTVLLWQGYRFGVGFSEHDFDRSRLPGAPGKR
jgi:outer membrane lipoprotein-sorting protein